VNKFSDLQVGDVVTRMLAGEVPMELKVTKIDGSIWCNSWQFHKETGAEIDEDCGWDGVNNTGSYLKAKEPAPKTDLELEPAGTQPVIGDYVVCFGDSAWRKIGKPYKVTGILNEVKDNVKYHDVMTAPDEFWEMARFISTSMLPQAGLMSAFDMPRVYRVVKRGTIKD
jgi:hypothetical protein